MVAAADGTRVGVHPAASYPDAVRAELARRRDQILVRATGRVLDLDEPGVLERFAGVGRTTIASRARQRPPAAEAAPLRYDTVVATGVLAGFADLGAITAALAELVADDGALLFVEPVAAPGWAHVLRASLPGPGGRRVPWRALALDRDVPAAVRAAGLVVCDLDRGELDGQPPSLRHWVSGRAVRIPGA
jgi:hypothetical protein